MIGIQIDAHIHTHAHTYMCRHIYLRMMYVHIIYIVSYFYSLNFPEKEIIKPPLEI